MVVTAITWSGSVAWRMPRKKPTAMMENKPINFSLVQSGVFITLQVARGRLFKFPLPIKQKSSLPLPALVLQSRRSAKFGTILYPELQLRETWMAISERYDLENSCNF